VKALVIYESMFGNTRQIASAIAAGLGATGDVTVCNVNRIPEGVLNDADVVVVGAPTHIHSLSAPATRLEADQQAHVPGRHLTIEPDVEKLGVREWMRELGPTDQAFAAFDTRFDGPRLLTGAAGSHISKELRQLGMTEIVEPESFLVRGNELESGEADRAREWGAAIGRAVGRVRDTRV
jgi:flavodoxin